MTCVRIPKGVVCFSESYKAGDPPPPDHAYSAWHEWAAIQHKAGLRQVRCGQCSLYRYPQELSDQVRYGKPVCAKCALNNLSLRPPHDH
jgi:hypothetical protein